MLYYKTIVLALLLAFIPHEAWSRQFYYMENDGIAIALLPDKCATDNTGQFKSAIMTVDSNMVLGCYVYNKKGNPVVRWSDGEIFEFDKSWFFLRSDDQGIDEEINDGSKQAGDYSRECSVSDFQACNSCDQLNLAVDFRRPDLGSYYRGAEWNGLFSAYVLNCIDTARSLINAGANPARGGTDGSMILTVSGAWPHDDIELNKKWAFILFNSGARIDTKINSPVGSSARELLAMSSEREIEYPEILELFSSPSGAESSNGKESAALQDRFRFSGGVIKYPLGLTQIDLERYIPELSCWDVEKEVLCTSDVVELSIPFVRGVSCVKDVAFSLRSELSVGATCTINNSDSASLVNELTKSYGPPSVKIDKVMGMIITVKTWVADGEEFKVVHYGGVDGYGSPLDDYSIHAGLIRSSSVHADNHEVE